MTETEETATIDIRAARHHPAAHHASLPVLDSYTISSAIPEVCRSEPCALGIDEAGRGPVLGPMVYGICFVPLTKQKDLKALGVDDSKQLTEEQRDDHFVTMQQHADFIGWSVEVLSPQDISSSMLRREKYNLNELSHDTAIQMIRWAIDQGVQVTEVYVDTVGSPEKYQAKLSSLFPRIKCTVAKKADSLYPVVSAASIAAKVTRDEVLQCWRFKEESKVTHRAFGSGYPGDPATKKWLADNIDPVFGFPGLIRFSWSTCAKLLKEKGVACRWSSFISLDNDRKRISNVCNRLADEEDDGEDDAAVQKQRASFAKHFAPKTLTYASNTVKKSKEEEGEEMEEDLDLPPAKKVKSSSAAPPIMTAPKRKSLLQSIYQVTPLVSLVE